MWTLPTIDSFNCYESCWLVVLARYSSSSLYLHSKVPKKLAKFSQKCCKNIIAIMQLIIVIVLYMSHATTQTLKYDQFTHLFTKCSILVNFYLRHNPYSMPPPDEIARENMFPKKVSTQAKLVLPPPVKLKREHVYLHLGIFFRLFPFMILWRVVWNFSHASKKPWLDTGM